MPGPPERWDRPAQRPARQERRSGAEAHAPLEQRPAQMVEAVETEMGGLFFLVNLALHLGLFSDFSAPEERGVDLHPWDVVALLGVQLLEEPSPGDPVWSLLAELAGRGEREPPGPGFDPPDAWRVPPEWLAPWPDAAEWTWSAAGERLRVRHPAGFLVVDVPAQAGAVDTEMAPYASLHPSLRRARVPGSGARGRPATRWARRLASYARPRLALALGLDQADAVTHVLLRRPARVLTTSTHVDVVFALASHPLEIRLAGLDRDPGWIPAAGRFLAFRFE